MKKTISEHLEKILGSINNDLYETLIELLMRIKAYRPDKVIYHAKILLRKLSIETNVRNTRSITSQSSHLTIKSPVGSVITHNEIGGIIKKY